MLRFIALDDSRFARTTAILVLAGAATRFACTSLWYSPLLFINKWIPAITRDKNTRIEDVQAVYGVPVAMASTLVVSLLEAFASAILFERLVDDMLSFLLLRSALVVSQVDTKVWEGRDPVLIAMAIGQPLVYGVALYAVFMLLE